MLIDRLRAHAVLRNALRATTYRGVRRDGHTSPSCRQRISSLLARPNRWAAVSRQRTRCARTGRGHGVRTAVGLSRM